MDGKKFTTDEYNGLNKIATATKMDCWFCIEEVDESEDKIIDLENFEEEMDFDTALSDFKDGIVDPLDSYGLTDGERMAVAKLLNME